MTEAHKTVISTLLAVSVALFLLPIAVSILGAVYRKLSGRECKKRALSRLVTYSGFLLVAVWCLRYAVGLFMVITKPEARGGLTWWEEIFNSMIYALQAFTVDNENMMHIGQGKEMLRVLFGGVYPKLYGIYASLLAVMAPITGGAIVFEIIASIFPKIRLSVSRLWIWRQKYYFSELNEGSLTLAKSILEAKRGFFSRPIIIFTDVYYDKQKEDDSELVQSAKQIGAICVPDDLLHIKKSCCGVRTYLLMDTDETAGLQKLTALTTKQKRRVVRNAEIYLFTSDDAYVSVEKNIYEKLEDEGVPQEKYPRIIPVQVNRNSVCNLLADLPLFEPIIGKKKKNLNVTILGSGHIGMEMFLATYWFGQILDYELNINVLSKEKEDEFWSKVNYINPEIRHTTEIGDRILKINRKGDMAPPYCSVKYISHDVTSSAFVKELFDKESKGNLLDTDYFLIALGEDKKNISTAEMIRELISEHHLNDGDRNNRAVIAYAVYEAGLAEILNKSKRSKSNNKETDVYMQAFGSIDRVFSVGNAFMYRYRPLAEKEYKEYLSRQGRKVRHEAHNKRVKNKNYTDWADLARAMHIKYKTFSVGYIEKSIFDESDEQHEVTVKAALERFSRHGKKDAAPVPRADELAWLEHRRWNAFTRVMGFRYSASYDAYAEENNCGSYKQMDLKLHPCLVECDKAGIRMVISEVPADGSYVPGSVERLIKGVVYRLVLTDAKENFDLLDELSYDLFVKGFNYYEFKKYDYTIEDELLKENELTVYKPKPIDTKGIELGDELLELTERLAENVHENWAAARVAQGWSYGEKRDDALKETPCLVPYNELCEVEKEYDRTTALETLKTIVALGYKIEKK